VSSRTAPATSADLGDLGRGTGEGVAHARVLDRGRHHVAGSAEQRGVHGLGARRGEQHFPRPRVEERRHLFAGLFERDPGRPSFGMKPSRITERHFQVRLHRGPRGRPHRRGGDVIEIRPAHTRVTQCSSPPGRLSVIVGDVSP
jgi:hypothetical protein